MTIYEQVQRAVEFAEAAIRDARGRSAFSQGDAAREAGMGERSFRTWFPAVTGLTWREYVLRRRLSEAARRLEKGNRPILEIALDAGYETHEAFTRAFTREFALSPRAYRRRGGAMEPSLPSGLAKIELYGEMYMGVIIKELRRMRAARFDGFRPNPEDKAKAAMNAWRADREAKAPRRVFGHNVNADGSVGQDPDNEGYRFYCVLADGEDPAPAPLAIIEPGTFAVTGIEGNFDGDPAGDWISAGWERMNAMIRERGYRVREPVRWFEEELEPSAPGNLRLDLYLEIER